VIALPFYVSVPSSLGSLLVASNNTSCEAPRGKRTQQGFFLIDAAFVPFPGGWVRLDFLCQPLPPVGSLPLLVGVRPFFFGALSPRWLPCCVSLGPPRWYIASPVLAPYPTGGFYPFPPGVFCFTHLSAGAPLWAQPRSFHFKGVVPLAGVQNSPRARGIFGNGPRTPPRNSSPFLPHAPKILFRFETRHPVKPPPR